MHKFAIASLVSLLAACAPVTPNYDAQFGSALRDAKLKMTINPDAGKIPNSVAGMDGHAAQEAILNYQESFKTPPPAVNVINIGGQVGDSNGGGK